jgi:hypothetical protein
MVHWHSTGKRERRIVAGIARGILMLALVFALSSLFGGGHLVFASGSGAYLYVHTSTNSNSNGDYTLLDNPVTNNNPSAVVFVTANWNPGGVHTNFDNRNVGVWYDAWAGKWGIFNEDGSSMPIGASFNVYALPTVSYYGILIQTVTGANTLAGYITVIDDANLNGNPSASFLVTQDWNPGGGGGVYNNHAIGAWYDSALSKWTIYNEDRTALPASASFNVVTTTGVSDAFTQVATSSNTSGDSTYTNDSPWNLLNNNPAGLAFVTHIYGSSGPYMTDPTAVWYNSYTGRWGVFDSTYANMPVGNSFFVLGATSYP